MIDNRLCDIIEPELNKGEELLWVGQSDMKKLRLKAVLIQLLAVIAIGIVVFGLYHFTYKEIGILEIITVVLIFASILIWRLMSRFKAINELAKNIYAATSTDFITMCYDLETGSKFVDRVPYKAMKSVHKMSMIWGASITFVLKGGLIPNAKQFFIDGFDKDTKLYKIVKQKINYI